MFALAWTPVCAQAQCFFMNYPLEQETALLTQPPPKDVISMVGAAEVRIRPTVLRMYLEFWSKGKSLQQAVQQFPARRQTVLDNLRRLGAKEDLTFVSEPTFQNSWERTKDLSKESETPRGMGGYGGFGTAVWTEEPPESAVVSATVVADWPLAAETHERRLLEAEMLKGRIRDAWTDEGVKLSDDEKRFMEHIYSTSNYAYAWPRPGRPYFTFIARVSNRQREEAIRQAFESARVQAERLADATGTELGPLNGLSSFGGRIEGGGSSGYWLGNSDLPWQLTARFSRPTPLDEEESTQTTSSSLDSLVFKFFVKTSFRLAEPSGKKEPGPAPDETGR